MKYYFDTEFIEDGVTIDLISMGIVAEDNREYYAINSDCKLELADDWVKENVISQLPPKEPNPDISSSSEWYIPMVWKPKAQIAKEVFEFVGGTYKSDGTRERLTEEPEFWAYNASYDWVAMAQLYGRLLDIPKGFPFHCLDIKQKRLALGKPNLPNQYEGLHNALEDARWNKAAYEHLATLENLLHH